MQIKTPDQKNSEAIVRAQPPLSDVEMQFRSFDLNKLYEISMVRESPQPQFDRLGYMKYNETNEMADMSFIPPKKNKMDSVIVSGMTHEKDTTLLSMLQNFNFEGRVRVYKDSVEQYDLGIALTAWVRASREQESYDQKRPVFYRNLLVQGTSFVQEKFVEHFVPNKVISTKDIDFTRLDQVKWVDAGWKKVFDGCVSDLVDGKKVFLENIREPDIQKQPGVYTVEYVPRSIIESVWKDTERWKYVPSQTTPITSIGYITQGSIYSDWTFAEVDYTKCEVIQAFRPFENRYQIYLNGVPMLPAGFPLTAISPSGLIPISKGDLDQMNMFAYSKSIPAKTKVDQAILDEIERIMLIKFQQGAFVPSVNNTGMMLAPNIFMPGRMNEGFPANKVEPLLKNPGVTQADFGFYSAIKEQIDNKSVSNLLEGSDPGVEMTLGQYLDTQKKQMLKLGSIFDGVIQWERQMLRLRLMNLIANGAKPMGQTVNDAGKKVNQYRDVSVDDSFGDADGTRILRFTEENSDLVRSPYDVFDEEIKYKEETGKEARYSYIDPVLLGQLLTDDSYKFHYEVVPVDKNNDKLTQAFFVNMITQAVAIFGPNSLNVQELKKRYAAVMGEEFDTIFKDERALELEAQQQAQAMAQAGGQPGDNASPFGVPVPRTADTKMYQ